MPTKRSVDNIKLQLLKPALTSHFEVEIPIPKNIIDGVLKNIGLPLNAIDQDKLNLLCCETSLPGSSLATLEINNDYTGVTERHAYRRLYDDRMDFTFYVDANSYLPIVFFESWIKYIVGESIKPDQNMRGGLGSEYKNYFYRVRYPDTYVQDQGLKIIKFERDYKSRLEYHFIRSYPISITSIPISYDSSNLLKCTVSMTYLRYIMKGPIMPKDPEPVNSISTPSDQASVNSINFGTALSLDNLVNSYGFSGGTGGVPLTAVNASGNTIQVQNFDTSRMTQNLGGTLNGGSGLRSVQS